ncbi:MAG: ASCH domain-containing protein [Candidatus Pacebacteria bacterium]|nr:ASCH domain-containing protein [Candidatus Paceibacterota bacterium]
MALPFGLLYKDLNNPVRINFMVELVTNNLQFMQYQMKLATEPFNKIASGTKLIESRLFDEKRQQISIGDQIVFSENENPENTVTTVVKGLLRYQTFKELFADHDPSLFGEDSKDFLLAQIKSFYSDEDEQKYGVVGVRLELVD